MQLENYNKNHSDESTKNTMNKNLEMSRKATKKKKDY